MDAKNNEVVVKEDVPKVGLYKLNAVETHSLKAA